MQLSRASPEGAASPSSAAPAAQPMVTHRRQKAADRPAAPSAVAATAVPGGAGAASSAQAGSAPAASGDTAARVRQALRRLGGCETPGLSTAAELEACRHERSRQYAIGEAMRMDPISSSAKREAYDRARDTCQSVYTYLPLDNDPNRGARAPQVFGNPC